MNIRLGHPGEPGQERRVAVVRHETHVKRFQRRCGDELFRPLEMVGRAQMLRG